MAYETDRPDGDATSAADGITPEELDALASALAAGEWLVPTDPRKLRPGELVRLLNSTPLGQVIDRRRLDRHREAAGNRIGGETIDLFRYIAWLVLERAARREPQSPATVSDYEATKRRAAEREREKSARGRDIGEIPDVVNPERRDACRENLQRFCEEYLPATFRLAWSEDHLRMIRVIERVVVAGGTFAYAMPRGMGKTVLCEAACLWAILFGHRAFVVVVGPDEDHARDRVTNFRVELEHNDRLAEDFPAVCHPIRRLEGINQRRLLYRGETVRMEFTSRRIILPNIPGSPASGSIIATAGLTGQIRGLNLKRDDGTVLRPSLVLLDDPQTDESARSPSQCDIREAVIKGAVLGLAGPGTSIAAIMPCTVVRRGDLADRMLNRELHPEWEGQRTPLVKRWPENTKLWGEYSDILRRSLQEGTGSEAATTFYSAHRAEMDAGAEIAWPARFNADELSALQNAYNLRIRRGERAFFAEYQNDPIPEEQVDEEALRPEEITERVNRHNRGVLPLATTHVTAFVDVQQKALYWMVVGWDQNFTGAIVDYGTEPDQGQAYFALRDIRRTLQVITQGQGLEAAIYAGLARACDRILGREYRREDNAHMRVSRCLIDANWGEMTNVVYEYCRQSPHAAVINPSHGKYVGAKSMPFAQWASKPGDRIGLNWRLPVVQRGRRVIQHVLIDTNYWKSFVVARLRTGVGGVGALTIFGANPQAHRLLADHLTAESGVTTSARGQSVVEWSEKSKGRDNHWFDCLVGCAVAASMCGAALPGTQADPPKQKRKSYKERYLEWQAARRG